MNLVRNRVTECTDLALSRDEQITSLGLMTDLAALHAAGLISMEGDDVRLTATEKGEQLMASGHFSSEIEDILSKIDLA